MTEETKTIRRTKIHSKTVIEIIFFISLSLFFHLNMFLSILYLSFCTAIPTKHNFRFSRQYILMFYNYTLFFDYFFFLDSRKPYPPKSALCGLRWVSKTPAVPGSYKRCTPWLELETCCANLKPFTLFFDYPNMFGGSCPLFV